MPYTPLGEGTTLVLRYGGTEPLAMLVLAVTPAAESAGPAPTVRTPAAVDI